VTEVFVMVHIVPDAHIIEFGVMTVAVALVDVNRYMCESSTLDLNCEGVFLVCLEVLGLAFPLRIFE